MPRIILPVILCGGANTSWPDLRETTPQQFIPQNGSFSTFQETLRRVADPIFVRPIVITNRDYRFLVEKQVAEMGIGATIVIEPACRDSGPAVAVASLAASKDPETVVAVCASDHVIAKQPEFLAACLCAAAAAREGLIVTLGVAPSEPVTSYGYIKPGRATGAGPALEIRSFVEKPNRATAERYIAEGYLWNSGNFFFRADVMLEELKAFEPKMAEAAERALNRAEREFSFLALHPDSFSQSPKKSIDYAVMERTRRAAVVPVDIGWSDVGSWDAVGDLGDRNQNGNVVTLKQAPLRTRRSRE
jgi:mannose-1-phosphate guanylyltransferase / mannose-6-phosphate isomerase